MSRPSCFSRRPPRLYQHGIVSIVAAILLIAVVVFILSQTYGIIGNTSNSNASQADSVGAFFAAESGVEHSTAKLAKAAASGALTGGDCTGLAPATYTLGTGLNFTVDSATAYDQAGNPAPSCLGGACAQCKVQVTGTAQAAKRTVEFEVLTKTSNGNCGFGGKNPTPVSLSLTNPTTLPTLGFFSIGWRVNGNNGPQPITAGNTDSSCTVGNCLAWLVKSSGGGSVSTGNLGALVSGIPSGVSSDAIAMPITENRPYSAIGILFEPRPGFIGSPQIVNGSQPSSFWDDKNGSSTTTVATATAGLADVGQVNSGVANSSGTCDASPSTTLGAGFNGSKQNCNNWCYGGDTIVMGLAGKSSATGDQTSVSFNSVRMKRAIHLPLTANECPSYTPPDTYTEIHYLYNRDYISTASSASSGGTFNGNVGVPSTAFNAKINKINLKLTVNSSMGAGRKLFINDQVYCDSNSGGCDNTSKGNQIATIAHYPAGCSESPDNGCADFGPSNTYDITLTSVGTTNFANNTNTALQVKSNQMQTAQTGANNWLSVGDVFRVTVGSNRNRSINGVPCTESGFNTCNTSGIYRIDAFDEFSENNLIAKGYTIHVTGGKISSGSDSLPNTAGAPFEGTVVAVRKTGGSGFLPPSSCVASSPTPTSTVFQLGTLEWNGTANVCNSSQRPALLVLPDVTDRLVTATLCGGTCGLFNDPDSTTSETDFIVTRNNAGTTQWAGGFACIKGIDPAKEPTVVTSSSTSTTKWHEVVR